MLTTSARETKDAWVSFFFLVSCTGSTIDMAHPGISPNASRLKVPGLLSWRVRQAVVTSRYNAIML